MRELPRYHITGGAGSEVTAAIAAAVAVVLEAERAAQAVPPQRSVPRAWVTATRARPHESPAGSGSMDRTGRRIPGGHRGRGRP